MYKETGEKNVFPKLAPESLTYKKEKYQLTTEELQQFQKDMGAEYKNKAETEIKSSKSDKNRAESLKSIADSAYNKAKDNYLKKKGLLK